MNAVVYSKDNCQWCERVIQLFNATDITVTEYKFGEHFNKSSFYEEFGQGATFPQVQLDNQHIGGCKETLQYLQKKKLI
mgnify:CR=1 FL=1